MLDGWVFRESDGTYGIFLRGCSSRRHLLDAATGCAEGAMTSPLVPAQSSAQQMLEISQMADYLASGLANKEMNFVQHDSYRRIIYLRLIAFHFEKKEEGQ